MPAPRMGKSQRPVPSCAVMTPDPLPEFNRLMVPVNEGSSFLRLVRAGPWPVPNESAGAVVKSTALGLPAGRAALARSAATSLWLGLVHGERASTRVCAVQSIDGSVGFCRVRHLDESKAPRAARIAVRHQADTIYGSVRLKEGPDRILCRAEIQVAYKNVLHVSLLKSFEGGLFQARRITAQFGGAVKRTLSIAAFRGLTYRNSVARRLS